MIHGHNTGYAHGEMFAQWVSWTDGCSALKNDEMNIVWEAVKVGTPIEDQL